MQSELHDSLLPFGSFNRRFAFYMAGFVLFVVGFVFGIYHLYFLFAAIMSALLLSSFWVRVSHRALRVEVKGPSEVTCGDEVEITAEIANGGMLARAFVEVSLPKMRWLKPIDTKHTQRTVLLIPPNDVASVSFKLEAQKRGIYEYNHVLVLARDPFGLFCAVKAFPCSYRLTVLPRVISIPFVWNTAGYVFGELSESNGEMSNIGMEFYGVREYHPGDPWKRIHWKVTAHTGKLSVMEFEREQHGNAVLVVDCDKRAHWGDGVNASIEHTAMLTASIASELLRLGASVTLIAEPFITAPGLVVDNYGELKVLLHELARIEPIDAPSVSEVIHKARKLHRRSASLVAVLTKNSNDAKQVAQDCDICVSIHDGFAVIEANALNVKHMLRLPSGEM